MLRPSDAAYTAALEAAGEPCEPVATAGDPRRLDAIRALLARFNWQCDDRQYALEKIERIVNGDEE